MSLLFLKGIVLGISLSFMIGPLLFSIVEASLARGFRAGIAVACGMWLSDFFYIGLLVFGIGNFTQLLDYPNFREIAGKLGGLVLCIFGAIMFFKNKKSELEVLAEITTQNTRSLFQLLLRGFFINTFNPGTIFFWLSIASALVIPSRWSAPETVAFFSGMIFTLILTDILKAVAAKKLRQFLTPKSIRIISKSIGLILIGFGVFMFFKSAG